jgi:hypothetical protein
LILFLFVMPYAASRKYVGQCKYLINVCVYYNAECAGCLKCMEYVQ